MCREPKGDGEPLTAGDRFENDPLQPLAVERHAEVIVAEPEGGVLRSPAWSRGKRPRLTIPAEAFVQVHQKATAAAELRPSKTSSCRARVKAT